MMKHFLYKIFTENNPYYRSIFGYSDKFWNHFPFGLQVVNLGSNTGLYGFRYDGLGVKAANWAMSPQSFNQDLAILKTYYSFIGPRGTVIVPLCPYSSCLKSYTDTEWLKYYTILHPGVIENFSKVRQEEAYRLKEHPLKYARKQMLIGFVQKVKNKRKGTKTLLELDYQPLSETEIERDAQSFIDGWKKQFKIDDMDAPLPQHIQEGRKIRVETLKEIMSFCVERNLNYYIVLPPVTQSLSSKFSTVFRNNYIYSFLDEAGVPQNRFLDYLEDSRFTDDSLFVNCMFLNKKGATQFTKQVLSDIGILK